MKPGPRGPTHCPAHDDAKPSLHVDARDGRVLVRCHGGCAQERVLEALRARGLWPEERPRAERRRIVATYDYVDEAGRLLFQVVRYVPKAFRQRRPNGNGGWVWSLDGVRPVLYRLPEVLEAVRADREVWIAEGEKDVEALRAAGVTATCNPGGAGKWRPEFAEVLRGAYVVVVRDRDEPGRRHAEQVIASLRPAAASVRLVEAKQGKDAADHLDAGLGLADFVEVPLPPAPDTDGARLLRDLESYFTRYAVLPEGAPIVLAAWVIHTHLVEEFLVTPYLLVTSPERRCGKTLLLDLLHGVVARPLAAANISEAALFRAVDELRPTLLLDEAQVLRDRTERSAALHDLLCAGHRRGQHAIRMQGNGAGMQLREFSVYGPKAIALIGRPTDVLLDRGVEVRMQRRAPHERVERFRVQRVEAEAEALRRRIEAWAAANRRAVAEAYARVEAPAFLDDRAADHWAPLLAVVAVADPTRLADLERAARLMAGVPEDEESVGVRLLADLRRVFDGTGEGRLPTDRVLEALATIEEAPWGDWGGRRLTPQGLAKLLRPFGVRPRPFREGPRGGIRGYLRADLEGVWARYLHNPGGEPQHPQQSSNGAASSHFSNRNTGVPVADAGNGSNPHHDGVVADVAVSGCGNGPVAQTGPVAPPPAGCGDPEEEDYEALERRAIEGEPVLGAAGGPDLHQLADALLGPRVDPGALPPAGPASDLEEFAEEFLEPQVSLIPRRNPTDEEVRR